MKKSGPQKSESPSQLIDARIKELACIMQRRDDPRRSAARSGDFSEPGLLVHAPHRLRLWA